MTIPAGPSEVTATWLGSALGEQVSSVSVTPVGTGQTGATYRVVPTYRYPNGMPSSFIAKLPSQLPDVRERVALGYRAEYAFYTHAADTVAAPLPRVYDCQIGADGAEFVLLMSDLHPAVQGDQIRGCDDRQARLAVTALAGLHGPRWCDPAWLSFDGVTMPKADADVARGMGELAHVALDATLSGLGNRINADQREVLTDSADLVEKWLMIYPNRFCLLHGDFRLDNLMFSPDRSLVTIVDWQTITVGLPARDLAYFLGTSLEPAVRAESEHALVDLYYRRLIYHGVTNYTGGQCWIDYRLGMLQVPLITTFGYAFAAATDRGDEMVLAMLARGCRAIRHLDTLELIRAYG
ncbi:phosphotransferase family protein [Mycobacteroides chelonae]|uniref:phosphotransferase family protein n=1 Tax=Mycobacteroides chelonae TaxID=1774 RepID=UPI0008A95881|nr:aminoglycoside phosphotransferase family protein [Mycobacteroides chelonae]OHU32931.1 aminoglycoside phosphotransferase [Mycobacteroides chelonae]